MNSVSSAVCFPCLEGRLKRRKGRESRFASAVPWASWWLWSRLGASISSPPATYWKATAKHCTIEEDKLKVNWTLMVTPRWRAGRWHHIPSSALGQVGVRKGWVQNGYIQFQCVFLQKSGLENKRYLHLTDHLASTNREVMWSLPSIRISSVSVSSWPAFPKSRLNLPRGNWQSCLGIRTPEAFQL